MVPLHPEHGASMRRRDRPGHGRPVEGGYLRFGGHGADDTGVSEVRTPTSPAAPDDAAVRLVGIEKRFGRTPVLRGVTLAFPRGRTTVVLGPSGCGKSVMLKHVVGLIRPDKGQVLFEGERIDTLSERALAPIRRRFGFLFQQGALFDSMSVRDNVAFPLRELEGDAPYDEDRRVRRVLRLVGLEDRMPSELSGGQQKRIALARAVVLDPEVVLYDEPTTGLDPIRSDVINELVLKLKRELGATSIVVTHDLASAFKVADHMVMLHEGQVILEGTPEAFRRSDDPVVSRFLRGEASEDELRAIREVAAANVESAVRGKAMR
jgi:phospholipid/cholesterol/gamma-HCH transport system ATP-binding protein